MLATAKVFTNGHSQAIRLPKAFRVDVDEMWIARNEVTGEITLKPKDTEAVRKRRLDALMAAIADNPLPDDFLSDGIGLRMRDKLQQLASQCRGRPPRDVLSRVETDGPLT